MPKQKSIHDYGNKQITEIIKEYVHDKDDRKMLYLRFVDGLSLSQIADVMHIDKKTVWNHLQKQENVIFSHIPYKPEDGE